MLTVSRESTNFTSSPIDECCCSMSEEESDDEEAKFVQRICDFVQDEKQFESSSDESASSSDDSDSAGNPEPEKRRRADDSDVELVRVTEVDGPENSRGGNMKSRRSVDATGAEAYSVENSVTSPEEPNLKEPKSADFQLPEPKLLEPRLPELKLPEPMLEESKPAVPDVRRRKPGPLRRRLKLMCKLNLDNIDVSAVRERKNLGNSTPVVGKSAGVPMTVNLPDETDDENYLLDEEKILGMFQDGYIVESSSEDNARQSELTAIRKDISRTSSGRKDAFSPTKKKTFGIQRTKNASLKEKERDSTENIRNLSALSGSSVEVEKPSLSGKIVNGPSKQSTPKFCDEKKSNNESKSQKCLSRLSPPKSLKDQREGSSTKLGDDSDFVSKKTDGPKPSKSPKKTPEKMTDVPKKSENGSVNQKKLLKGPKSRQSNFSSEEKMSTEDPRSDAVKKYQKSLFNVEKYVQKSPKSLNRIPLRQEAILARSQMNSSRLSLSTAKNLPPKDAAAAVNEKTAKSVLKEPAKKTSQKAEQCLLSPTNDKPPLRPQSRNSGTDENIPSPSCKASQPSPCKNISQSSPKKGLAIKNENNSERNCDKESENKLFSRPVRPERNDNIPRRIISQGSRMSSPWSDFATRRNIPAAQEEEAEKETNDQTERTLAKLGLPNCEEPVYINWNHSNIPSVVNPEGMSLCEELLSFYRKDLGVNEAIVCQLGKLDPLVLSEASKSRTTPESSLSRRLSDVQIPSMNLSKDILSEIDSALNTN